MLDQFVYENHLGQRFDGLANGVYLNYSELRDYSWSYDTINNKISRFYRSIKDRKIPLWIHCKSEADAISVKNELYQITDVDVEAKKPGKIYIGKYYTHGYITSSIKSNYLINKKMCKLDLVLTSDDPAWFSEQKHRFLHIGDSQNIEDSGVDYPYDYQYDYALITSGTNIMCNTTSSSAFKLLIYGPAVNPTILIGNHVYKINGTIFERETLLIDSLTKTITLTMPTGASVNWYHKRSRENYIFEPLPPGKNVVTWSGAFDFDLTTVEKRSEPLWI